MTRKRGFYSTASWRTSDANSASKLETTNQNYRDRLNAAGLPGAQAPKPKRTVLETVGDWLSRADYAFANVLNRVADRWKSETSKKGKLLGTLSMVTPGQEARSLLGNDVRTWGTQAKGYVDDVVSGYTGKKKGDLKQAMTEFGFSTTPFRERKDFVGRNIGKIPIIRNWSPAGGAALGASLFNPLDPTNYVGLGQASDIGKTVVKEGVEQAPKWGLKVGGNVVRELPGLRRGLQATGKYLAEDAPGISKIVQAIGPNLSRYFRPKGQDAAQWTDFNAMRDAYDAMYDYAKRAQPAKTAERLGAKATPREVINEIGRLLERPEFYDNPSNPLVEQVLREARHWSEEIAQPEISAGILGTERAFYRPRTLKEQTPTDWLKRISGRKTSPIKVKTGSSEARKLWPELPFEEVNQKLGYELFDPDYLRAATTRDIEHATAMETNRFIGDVLGKFGRKLNPGEQVPEGMVEFSARQFGHSVPYALPKAIGDQMNQYVKYATNDSLTRVFDPVTGLWKSYATASPGFQVRNAAGDTFRQWQKNSATLGDIIRSVQGQLGSKRTIKTAMGDISLADAFEYARKTGGTEKLGGTAFSEMAARNPIRDNSIGGVLGNWNTYLPWSQDFLPLRANRAIGDVRENTSRFATFINALRKGATPEQAAKQVNKVHFDYTNLTPAAKNLRRFIPFLTWTANNVPAQARLLVEDPAKITRPLKVLNAMRNEFADDESSIPPYMRQLSAAPTGLKDKNGNPLYINPNIPIQDLNKLNPLEFIMQGMHPLAKEAVERKTGQSIYFNRPVERYPGAMTTMFGMPISEKNFNTVRNLNPMLGSLAKIGQAKQQGGDAANLQLLSYGGGIKLMPYNKEQERKNRAYEEQDRLQALIRLFTDQGKLQKSTKATASRAKGGRGFKSKRAG